MSTVTLSGIHVHPIKSCQRMELDRIEVSDQGLAGDREWQVVAPDGSAVTQRQVRGLATVRPEPIDGGLRLSAPGHDAVEVARPSANDRTVQALLGDEVEVADAGDAAAAFFTAVAGEECRLVAMTSETERRVPLVRQQPVTFVDASPVLVATEASLADLVARASEPFGMDRFRPNLVVAGTEPWVEDTWRSFRIGDASLEYLMPWPRCAVPQIDQDTAERRKEPAVALKASRWCVEAPGMPPGLRAALEGNALFGVGCAIGESGTELKLGDPVEIDSTDEPLLAPPD